MSDLSGLLPIRASTPFSANHHNTPSVVASPHPIEHPVQDDAAPYGIVTNKEELRATIHKVLKDMASGSAPSGPNRVVTIQRLPDNINDALSHFFSYLLWEEQQLRTNDTELDTANDTNDDSEGKTFRDTRSEGDSEPESEHFYTALNNSAKNLIVPNTEIQYFANAPENLANAPWGTVTPLCACHQESLPVAAGLSPDWPFAGLLKFEFVKWMVVNDISQTARDKLIKRPIMECCWLLFASNYALNKLLDKLPSAGPRWRRIQRTITGTLKDTKGVNFLKEEIELWVRDIVEVVQELIRNTAYGNKLVFVPQRVKINNDPSSRKIDKMWTADWWMRIQKLLPPGATVVPIVLSSDATQLTNFSGGKSAWPVYKARIFHESMAQILDPLLTAGVDGVEMNCGDGYVQQCYPILTAYIADNPEQTMIAGCQCNLCHRCTAKHDQRGNYPETPPPPRIPDHTAVALEAHDYGHTSALFSNQGLKPFGKPFWANLLHTNIFSCLTPDILHQLHKGVFKDHLMDWCLKLVKHLEGSVDSVDNRYKSMPNHSGLRHFASGVTKLKQTTANEHREMQKVFTAVMAGLVPENV
ncbi:hypothetical protein FRC06_001853 [Ceratobasidium sp. 370]|nr:hypothetical protein FRC06_001853 [Ceratobasidium sp. 370]